MYNFWERKEFCENKLPQKPGDTGVAISRWWSIQRTIVYEDIYRRISYFFVCRVHSFLEFGLGGEGVILLHLMVTFLQSLPQIWRQTLQHSIRGSRLVCRKEKKLGFGLTWKMLWKLP